MQVQDTRSTARYGYDAHTDTIRAVGADGLASHEEPLTLEDAVRHLEARVEGIARATDGTGPVAGIGQPDRSRTGWDRW